MTILGWCLISCSSCSSSSLWQTSEESKLCACLLAIPTLQIDSSLLIHHCVAAFHLLFFCGINDFRNVIFVKVAKFNCLLFCMVDSLTGQLTHRLLIHSSVSHHSCLLGESLIHFYFGMVEKCAHDFNMKNQSKQGTDCNVLVLTSSHTVMFGKRVWHKICSSRTNHQKPCEDHCNCRKHSIQQKCFSVF